MSIQLDLIEVSDFLVERARPRASIPLSLPGRKIPQELGDIVIFDPNVTAAAGCCCCCCCCNCNSGGAAMAVGPQPPIFGEIDTTVISVQPGPAERRSIIKSKGGSFLLPQKSQAFIGASIQLANPDQLIYSLELDDLSEDAYITHTWYGPDRTARYGGVATKDDFETISILNIDKQSDGVWKVISRDISGAIISLTAFSLSSGGVKIIDAEFSPITAVLSEIRSSLEDRHTMGSTFSPRLHQLYFVTDLGKDVSPNEIQHLWYRGETLMNVAETEEYKGLIVSRYMLPSDALGGWYAVAVDSAGRHITSASFSVRGG